MRREPRSRLMVRVILSLVMTTLSLAMVTGAATTAGAEPARARLATVDDFAFALGVDLDGAAVQRLAGYDLVVTDGELTKKARVAQLKANGADVVLGYLSVGTIEPFRGWYDLLKPYRLKSRFEEFDEFYARVNDKGFRTAIVRRIAPKLLTRGFDGLFLDNTDMVDLHPGQKPGMRKLVRALSKKVHRRKELLFAQNGEDSIGPLLRYYDGWNREDVSWTYDFDRKRYVRQKLSDVDAAQSALRWIGNRGLLVTATDYTAAGDSAAFDESVQNACAVGALPFVSNIGLTRIPQPPPNCQ